MIERAVAVFSRSKYHVAHHARALFLKYEILKKAGEIDAADQALTECTILYKQLVPDHDQAPGSLSRDDLDKLLPPWFR